MLLTWTMTWVGQGAGIIVAACLAVLAGLFAVGGVYYAFQWRNWASKFPVGDVAFICFLIVCALLNVMFFIAIALFVRIAEDFWQWLALLIVADIAASIYCYFQWCKRVTLFRPSH